VETQTAMTISPNVADKFRNLTVHYIYRTSPWSNIPNRKRILAGLALDGTVLTSKILRSSYT